MEQGLEVERDEAFEESWRRNIKDPTTPTAIALKAIAYAAWCEGVAWSRSQALEEAAQLVQRECDVYWAPVLAGEIRALKDQK